MKIIYVADDGKQFDDEWDCKDYEWGLNHPHLKDIVCYDQEDRVLENIYSQDTYENVMHIEVPSDEAAKELRELGRYCGFCSYENIEEAGIYVWKDGINGGFVKVWRCKYIC